MNIDRRTHLNGAVVQIQQPGQPEAHVSTWLEVLADFRPDGTMKGIKLQFQLNAEGPNNTPANGKATQAAVYLPMPDFVALQRTAGAVLRDYVEATINAAPGEAGSSDAAFKQTLFDVALGMHSIEQSPESAR